MQQFTQKGGKEQLSHSPLYDKSRCGRPFPLRSQDRGRAWVTAPFLIASSNSCLDRSRESASARPSEII